MPESEVNIHTHPVTDDTGHGVFSHDVGGGGGSHNVGFHPRCGFTRDFFVSTTYEHYGNWLLFQLPLKVEDEILEARLIFYGFGETSDPASYYNYEMRIKAHEVDNAAAPVSLAEISGWAVPANMTTAEVFLTVPPFSQGYEIQTDDLKDIIREIIDRAGWVKDNKILFITKTKTPFHNQVGVPQYGNVSFWRYDQGEQTSDTNILLYIRYNEAPPGPAIYDQAVVHDLTITQIITYRLLTETVEHTLEIEQDITFVLVHEQNIEHTLTFIQDINYVQIHEYAFKDLLIITQTIAGNTIRQRGVEHTLVIEQENQRSTKLDKQVIHRLTFEQDLLVTYVYNLSVEHSVVFEQDYHTSPQYRDVEHVLVVTQQITTLGSLIANAHHVEHTITFQQDIVLGGIRTRAVEHTLHIVQSLLGYMEVIRGVACGRIDLEYAPQADSSVGFPTEPTLTVQDVVLQYPPTSPTLSITLPMPLFGNREELTLTRIQRRTRGGTLKTFSADDWAKVKVLRYKFDSLNTAKIEELFTFLGQTLGLKVRLIDYEGRQWDGFIVNPDGESAQYFQLCGNTTQFDFDGVLV